MKIAIQGHPTRGKEIIQILRSLGATSYGTYDTCSYPKWYWYINKNREITCDPKRSMCGYKLYTLEEFEKEFPFKVGDMVVTATERIPRQIIAFKYYNDKLCYTLEDGFHYKPQLLELYKEMKEERNITLTLDKAKEWYKKGGELKEIALQAFTEKELNPLPRSWEEFCEKYSKIDDKEYFIDSDSNIIQVTAVVSNYCRLQNGDRNICPSIKSAEAHLAMIQLEQLRNCWWNGWEPEWNNCEKYVIKWDKNDLIVFTARNIHAFLVFPTREMAEEFLECFRDLIEKAGDLI